MFTWRIASTTRGSRPRWRWVGASTGRISVFYVLNGPAVAAAFIGIIFASYLAWETTTIINSSFGPEAGYQRMRRSKADACHQERPRCFLLNDRHMPICARCLGIRLGATVGIVPALVIVCRRRLMAVGGLLLLALLDIVLKPLGVDSPNLWRLMAGTALGCVVVVLYMQAIRLLWYSPEKRVYPMHSKKRHRFEA